MRLHNSHRFEINDIIKLLNNKVRFISRKTIREIFYAGRRFTEGNGFWLVTSLKAGPLVVTL